MSVINVPVDILFDIDHKTLNLLEEKKIYFTFAYIGTLRCYKHNQLIWQAHAPCRKNKVGGYEFDEYYLIERGKECVEFFKRNGYIPNEISS